MSLNQHFQNMNHKIIQLRRDHHWLIANCQLHEPHKYKIINEIELNHFDNAKKLIESEKQLLYLFICQKNNKYFYISTNINGEKYLKEIYYKQSPLLFDDFVYTNSKSKAIQYLFEIKKCLSEYDNYIYPVYVCDIQK